VQLSAAAVLMSVGLGACGANNDEESSSASSSGCFSALDSRLVDSVPPPPEFGLVSKCEDWHLSALERAKQMASSHDFRDAESLLQAFRAKSSSLEAERLYFLYVMAKVEDRSEDMARLNIELQESAKDSPYAMLVSGVEECVHGDCSSAVSRLELANKSIDTPMAKGYLAASYAYSGRMKEAEVLFDQMQGQVSKFDELTAYVMAGTYVKVSRPEDARRVFKEFYDANQELEGSFLWQETMKFLEVVDER
jgi:tetratricopeptide (TPR) repeat protein